MKLSISAALLAATSALAAPAPTKQSGGFSISNLHARKSLDHTLRFGLLDTNHPSGPLSTECTLIWPANSAPDADAACGPDSGYKIRFPDGFEGGIGKFTLAVERVNVEPIGGRAYLDENAADGRWKCVEDAEGVVKKDCVFEGVYEIAL
ncbi:hypothetical protein FQN50_000208 [Emmonsiellopsis sp. PD_5]|nr:hypothetical protein FQN50_000208 [Emmonsiellopsis sp. PD_5]